MIAVNRVIIDACTLRESHMYAVAASEKAGAVRVGSTAAR